MNYDELEKYAKNFMLAADTMELEDLKTSYTLLTEELDNLRKNVAHSTLELELVWAIRKCKEEMVKRISSGEH